MLRSVGQACFQEALLNNSNALALARHNAGRHAASGLFKHPVRQPLSALVLGLHRGAQRLWPDTSDGLQIPGSYRRLDRLTKLISDCQYSFHDLSRVELDSKRPATPRFNMPFELGLAVAWAEHVSPEHRWYVFEAKNIGY